MQNLSFPTCFLRVPGSRPRSPYYNNGEPLGLVSPEAVAAELQVQRTLAQSGDSDTLRLRTPCGEVVVDLGFADRETQGYERAIGIAAPTSPAAPSLGSIFANAQQTAKESPWAGRSHKQVATLTCVHCGGPQEQPMDFMCRYCRRPIAGALKPTV